MFKVINILKYAHDKGVKKKIKEEVDRLIDEKFKYVNKVYALNESIMEFIDFSCSSMVGKFDERELEKYDYSIRNPYSEFDSYWHAYRAYPEYAETVKNLKQKRDEYQERVNKLESEIRDWSINND